MTGVRKVTLLDMGPKQEYRFVGGMADRWKDQWVDGVTQLKQLTFDQWVLAFQFLRKWNSQKRSSAVTK